MHFQKGTHSYVGNLLYWKGVVAGWTQEVLPLCTEMAKDLKGLSFNYFSMVVMSLYEVDLLLYVAFCDQWHTFVRSLPKTSSCLVCYLRVVKN